MSVVDERVVSMKFEDKGFEAGATRILGILGKLEESLKFKNGTNGLDAVKRASGQFNMAGVETSISIVSSKFSAFQEFVTGVFRRLGERAFDFGSNLIKSVTFKPLIDGFKEYELQMGSIQTIQANTGESVETINGALDELNTYADKTIYNFSQMTRNIGTFTAAGVDLETSTKAIQGIANLAAVSGSSAQQASTAMYQLSQALAAGTVKLQDWNSVVNAGMGGKVFQDALKRTARAHGIAVDDIIAKEGSFRESLKEGWITSEVLTDTLNQLSITYEEVGDEAYNAAMQKLLDSNYSQEDAEAILELAKTAEEAATMVRTWTQLWETVGEALGSGWATSWRIIVGDFNQATEFFSWLSKKLSDIVNESAQNRNNWLKAWAKAGGREGVIGIIANSLKALEVVASSVSKAFSKVFGLSPESVAKSISSFAKLSEKLVLNKNEANYLRVTFVKLFKVFKGALSVIKDVAEYIGSLGVQFRKALKQSNAFRRVVNLIQSFSTSFYKIIKAIGTAFTETFRISDKTSGFLAGAIGKILRLFENFANAISVTDEFAQKLHDTFKSFFELIKSGGNPLSAFGSMIQSSLSGVFDGLKNFNITEWISERIASIDFSKVFSFGVGIVGVTLLKDLAGSFKDILSGLKEEGDKFNPFKKVGGVLDNVSSALKGFQEKVNVDKIKEIGKALIVLSAALLVLSLIPAEKIGPSLVALAGAIGEMFVAIQLFTMIGNVKKTAISVVISSLAIALLGLSVAMKLMSTIDWEGIAKGLVGVGVLLIEFMLALGTMPTDLKKLWGISKVIKSLSLGILMLSVAVKLLSTIDTMGMVQGILGIAAMLAAMVAVMNCLPESGRIISSAIAITLISASLTVLSLAVIALSGIRWQGIVKGVGGIAGMLFGLTVALNLMPKNAWILLSAIAITILSAALSVLAFSIKMLSSLSWEGLAKGLIGVELGLAAIVAALHLMPDSAKLILVSVAFIGVSYGLSLLADAIFKIARVSWQGLARGLIGICVGLAALTLALNLMPNSAKLMLVSVAFIGISYGLSILSEAVSKLAGLGWQGLAQGLLGVMALLVELGAALYLMKSNILAAVSLFILAEALNVLAPSILTLGKAKPGEIVTGLLALAGAIAAVCLAAYLCKPAIPFLVAIALSLAVIGIAAASIIQSVTDAGQAISGLIGPLKEAGGNLIQGLIDGILGYGQQLVDNVLEAAKQVYTSICNFFGIESPSTLMAEVGTNIVLGLINGIGEMLGSLLAKAAEIPGAILQGIGDLAAALGTKISEGATAFLDGVGSLVTSAKEKASELGTNIKEGVGGFVEGIGSLAGAAKDRTLELANNAKEGFLGFVTGAAEKASEGVTSFTQGISGKAGAAKDATTKLVTNVQTSAATLTSKMRSKANEAMNAFCSGISAAAGRARSASASVMNAAASGIGSLWSRFYSTGKNAADGLAAGIYAGLGAARAAADRLMAEAEKAANARAKIKSPSRVFMGIGEYLGEGLAIGMGNTRTEVSRASSDLAGTTFDSFRSSLSAMSVGLDDLLDTDYNPVITPVIDSTEFDSSIGRLATRMNALAPTDLSIGTVNYNQEFASKLSDYANTNRQAIEAVANNAIDYDILGASVANALIRSGVRVQMDSGELVGYLAGEISDVRRMYM